MSPRLSVQKLLYRREARNERRNLERELAAYRTPSEVEELDAILARYDDRQVAGIRQILDRNRIRNRAA